MQYIYYLEMMISKHLFSPNEQIVEEQSNIQKKKKKFEIPRLLNFVWSLPKFDTVCILLCKCFI